jgi:hypothetical protein
LYNAVIKYKFDVAFVTNESDIYAAALQERSLYTSLFSTLDERLIEEADKLISYAQSEKLVVFIGAGISAAAGMPMWGQLLGELEIEADITQQEKQFSDQLPFLDRAHFIEERLQLKGRSLQTEISK